MSPIVYKTGFKKTSELRAKLYTVSYSVIKLTYLSFEGPLNSETLHFDTKSNHGHFVYFVVRGTGNLMNLSPISLCQWSKKTKLKNIPKI